MSIGSLPPDAAISPRELSSLSIYRRVPRRDRIGARLRIAVALLLTTVLHEPALDIFVLHDPAFDHHTWRRRDGDRALPAATWRTAALTAAA